MKIIFNDTKYFEKYNDLVIGQFEMIHFGHLQLFEKLSNFSFLIFENNPSKKYSFYSLEERIKNLEKYSPKNIFIYNIKKNNTSAIDFINNYLLKINPKRIIVGNNFLFGKNKDGNIELLKKYFNVLVVDIDKNYSTSNIISYIKKGNVDKANLLLPSLFYFEGIVIYGNQKAKELGYPTANMKINSKIKIKSGSYVAKIEILNKVYYGVSFVGNPKTLKKDFNNNLETYIFNFNKNIYGENIKIFLLEFIRLNQKFENLKQLVNAIKKDSEYAIDFLNKNKLSQHNAI